MGWYAEFGFDGASVDPTVVKSKDLGVELKLASVEEWCRKQDWEKYLDVIE